MRFKKQDLTSKIICNLFYCDQYNTIYLSFCDDTQICMILMRQNFHWDEQKNAYNCVLWENTLLYIKKSLGVSLFRILWSTKKVFKG